LRAALGADLLALGDDPPDRHPGPVWLGGEVGERVVDAGAQRVAHFGERVRGEVGAERLLLHRQQLAALELGGGNRWTVVRLRTPSTVGTVAEIEDRSLSQLRVLLRFLAR